MRKACNLGTEPSTNTRSKCECSGNNAETGGKIKVCDTVRKIRNTVNCEIIGKQMEIRAFGINILIIYHK